MLATMVLAGCQSKDGVCRIKGTVSMEQFDGKQIFLVPLYGPQTAEYVDSVVIKDGKFEFTTDTVSGPIGPIGSIAVQIVEREAEKCVKFASTNSPVSFKLWIQMLPTSDTTSKIKVTIDADLNFFMKQMLGSHLEKGVDKFADMLAMIPYDS